MLTVGHSVLSVPGVGGVRIEDTFHLRDGRAHAAGRVRSAAFALPVLSRSWAGLFGHRR